MIHALLILLACQLAGEVAVRVAGVPLPGPVVGLVFLLGGLMVVRRVPAALERTAGGLLSHLSLLFVPAGVGIIVHLERIRTDWVPLTAALIGSTALTVAVTALVFHLVAKATGAGAEDGA